MHKTIPETIAHSCGSQRVEDGPLDDMDDDGDHIMDHWFIEPTHQPPFLTTTLRHLNSCIANMAFSPLTLLLPNNLCLLKRQQRIVSLDWRQIVQINPPSTSMPSSPISSKDISQLIIAISARLLHPTRHSHSPPRHQFPSVRVKVLCLLMVL
jgi:hypothetical protein